MPDNPTVEQRLQQVAADSIIKLITEGQWIQPDYKNRFQLPAEFLEEIYKSLDKDAIIHTIKARIEEELADKVVNLIAAEISTDIKKVMAIKERRENLQYFVAKHIDELVKVSGE